MALQKNAELQNGLSVNKAYFRIDTISGYKGSITISVNSYTSQQSFLNGNGYLEQMFYTFVPEVNPEAKEIWTQAYEYLKKQEEFKDAIDC